MDILDEGIKTTPEADEIEIGRIEHDAEMGLTKIKNARIAFLVLSIFAVLSILLSLVKNTEIEPVYIVIEGVFMCAGYLTAMFLIPRFPKGAIIGGLCFYLLVIILNTLASPTTIFSGIFLKIIVVYYLVKAVGGASEFLAANEELKIYGREKTITW